MRSILTLLLAWALIFSAPLSFSQVSFDATKTGTSAIGSSTWAAKPAASSVPAGTLIYFTDVGENGAHFQSNGMRWRALNGSVKLYTRTAATAAIANVETNALQALIPAGLLQVGDVLRVKYVATKSGTTDAMNVTGRLGAAGTTADTVLNGLNALGVMAAAGVAGGAEIDFVVISATSIHRLGPNTAAATSYSTPSSAATQTIATTVTDMSANALYLSINIASSGATNTVTMHPGASIELITP